MFEYKNASFYTEFFNNLNDFSVIEEFKESENEDEKNLFIGCIEVLNTIHPLIIRVEIPFTFPHNKLMFRTKSLSGYPHLIHSGKVEYGDWFCLNTPFAETAEEQLNQEVLRLKEWIAHQMRNDLPPIIEDYNVKRALAFANAYEWENLDEIKEFCSQAVLTFVGDFHNDVNYFKKNIGHIHCVESPDNRLYAITDEACANHKLPYIIVDEAPSSAEVMSDFIKLKESYGWDEKICKHLFPKLDLLYTWRKSNILRLDCRKMTKEEALTIIHDVEVELQKEESYLLNKETNKCIKVLPTQKKVLIEEIKKIKEQVQKTIGPLEIDMDICLPNYENMTEEEIARYDSEEYWALEVYPYKWQYFALGIKNENNIQWFILYTCPSLEEKEEICFDLGIKSITLKKTVSYPLKKLVAHVITEDMYFGRGSFSANMKTKKVAIIGLGAIGSMVASALAHSGISKIGLWDNDIVEPGNICRSTYSIKHLGDSKVCAIKSIIKSINPFIESGLLRGHGYWTMHNANLFEYKGGSFYANVNYNTQEEAVKEIKDYDLIIDCTGSNEMLHFLSYAVPEADIISLCITNHANELLCLSNKDGNPFELRKAYLSRIEQDTKNFYVEGDGCYSPTFLATNCDIAALVNYALRELNKSLEDGYLMHSTIYSFTKRGIIADRLSTYKLDEYDIILNVSSETKYDAEEMNDVPNGEIGYIFGSYSSDGKQIMITHIVNSFNAKELLNDAYKTSKGLIDYIGDYSYSGEQADTYSQYSLDLIASKAEDSTINTNNPLLAVRNPDGSITFFLYINNELVMLKSKPNVFFCYYFCECCFRDIRRIFFHYRMDIYPMN